MEIKLKEGKKRRQSRSLSSKDNKKQAFCEGIQYIVVLGKVKIDIIEFSKRRNQKTWEMMNLDNVNIIIL